MAKKTYKKWEKSGLSWDDYLNRMDEIDEEFYLHIGECVAPHYSDQHFVQSGEPSNEIDGICYHATAMHINSRYYFLGDMPAFKN